MNPFAKKVAAEPPSETEVKTAIRTAIADIKSVDDEVVNINLPPETRPLGEPGVEDEGLTEHAKLSKLIEDDFPFDESQLAAINGLVNEQYGCLTGAAGTGKTTTTKKLVDSLLETTALNEVNMAEYWKADVPADADDEYESEAKWVPSVAMCAFTGRATQMIKKNFPRDWHGNIMTIHRLLGFVPEFYEAWDEEQGAYRNKMRFAPTYDADCKLPWDIVIIDETGMLGLDLWEQLWAAMKPGARIYMIGDINQLPPVHGKSVFGFAMAKWPAWELTHVHRQQGKNNPIVDNAWRILHGRMPVSEGRFQMIELKGDAQMASRKVRAMAQALQAKNVYDPIRDTIITPINGEEGSRGFALGQLPLNREFALIFNPQSDAPRYIIDGGRERKQFAVGDKVMATKNDWEAGITNGMTGVITSIAPHGGYSGEHRMFGRVEDVNNYLRETGDGAHVEFSLEDLDSDFEAIDEGMRAKKEKRERGPSSHIVTVRFGDEDHGIEIPFSTLSEVGSLMTAYVVTCHKMQGGESPTVIIILHDSHKAMLYREWLYTAVTRASQMCVVLYNPTALRTALSKQNIKGATLQEKVKAFNAQIDPKGLLGVAVKVNMPESKSTGNRIMDSKALVVAAERHMTTDAEKKGGLAELLASKRHAVTAPSEPERMSRILDAVTKPQPQSEQPRVIRPEFHIHTHHHHLHAENVTVVSAPESPPKPTVDAGEMDRKRNEAEFAQVRADAKKRALADMHKQRLWIGVRNQLRGDTIKLLTGPKVAGLLTHQPSEPVKPKNPWAARLGR